MGNVGYLDLAALAGVVMVAATFFQRTGRVPSTDDAATTDKLLEELGLSEVVAKAQAGAILLSRPVEELVATCNKDQEKLHDGLVRAGLQDKDAVRVVTKLVQISEEKTRATENKAEKVRFEDECRRSSYRRFGVGRR